MVIASLWDETSSYRKRRDKISERFCVNDRLARFLYLNGNFTVEILHIQIDTLPSPIDVNWLSDLQADELGLANTSSRQGYKAAFKAHFLLVRFLIEFHLGVAEDIAGVAFDIQG